MFFGDSFSSSFDFDYLEFVFKREIDWMKMFGDHLESNRKEKPHLIMNVWFFFLQRSNGASLICLHEQTDRNGDRYHYYVLYGLLAWTNDSANGDHSVSPHLFTNIFNYRYWLDKRLKIVHRRWLYVIFFFHQWKRFRRTYTAQ